MGPKRRLQRGRFLLEMPKQHGARPPDAGLHDATPLKDLGIKKNQSVRLQCMALVPEEERRDRREHGAQTFTPREEIAILRAYREHERREAKKRQGRPGRPRSGKFPEQSHGEARDKLGAYLGKSGRTIDKQLAVIEAAEAATSAW